MTSLAAIFNSTGKTDKATTHTYAHVYEWLLAPYRNQPINLLEIGVSQHGGGCLMGFAEWLPMAGIYGLDNDLSRCCDEVRTHPRIKLFKQDAYQDAPPWGNFTVIIDDAIHLVANQAYLLSRMMPYLFDDGIYVIEDCLTADWLPRLPHFHAMGLRHTLIDMSTPEQGDNTMIIWRKT